MDRVEDEFACLFGPSRSRGTNPKEVNTKLRALLPSKYRYVSNPPVIFLSTRTGEIGSALFTSVRRETKAEINLARHEAQVIAQHMARMGYGPVAARARAEARAEAESNGTAAAATAVAGATGAGARSAQQSVVPATDFPSDEDLSKYVVACGRKYVIVSRHSSWVHLRYLHNSSAGSAQGRATDGGAEQQGLLILVTNTLMIVCVYEKPMHSGDAIQMICRLEDALLKMEA